MTEDDILLTISENTEIFTLSEDIVSVDVQDNQVLSLEIDDIGSLLFSLETIDVINNIFDGNEPVYATRVDFITDEIIYRAEAAPGTLDSDASWRIRYITIAGDGDVTTTWANGSDNFNKIWDNRLSYVYS